MLLRSELKGRPTYNNKQARMNLKFTILTIIYTTIMEENVTLCPRKVH
jgi:hypothetical protein